MKNLTNVEIIKKNFIPEMSIHTLWKTDFINSINPLLEKNGLLGIKKDDLKDTTFESALDRYEELINNWTPKESLDVFWIKGFKIFKIFPYNMLKEIYLKYDKELVNEVFNSKKSTHNETILIKLAFNKDLTESDYKNLEINNITLYNKKIVNFPLFTKLVKISKLYDSNVIWESYLEKFKSDQSFINKVKDLFENQKIKYEFDNEELPFFSKNRYARELKINPDMLYKYNPNILKTTLDDFVTGLNNWFHEFAKKIEENAEMQVDYQKTGNRTMIIKFQKKESMDEFDNIILKFEKYYKDIVSAIVVDKNKSPSVYVSELMKIANYYHFNDTLESKNKQKKNKI